MVSVRRRRSLSVLPLSQHLTIVHYGLRHPHHYCIRCRSFRLRNSNRSGKRDPMLLIGYVDFLQAVQRLKRTGVQIKSLPSTSRNMSCMHNVNMMWGWWVTRIYPEVGLSYIRASYVRNKLLVFDERGLTVPGPPYSLLKCSTIPEFVLFGLFATTATGIMQMVTDEL
jgi:hypothetical protein